MKSAVIFCCIALSLGLAVEAAKRPYLPAVVVVDGVMKTAMRDRTDSGWWRAELETPSNTVEVAFRANMMPYHELRCMIDAEIRVQGIRNSSSDASLCRIDWIEASAATVLKPPPKDPFAAPVFVIGMRSRHRQRIDGSVVATRNGRAFIRWKHSRSAFEVFLAEEAERPPIGARVTVVGFITSAARRVILSESLVRVDEAPDSQERETLMEIEDGERLFTTPKGADVVNLQFTGRIVRLRGTALSAHEDASDPIFLKCGKRTVRIDMDIPGGYPRIPVGATLEVVGLCRLEFEERPADTLIQRFKWFEIFPRTAADVKVLAWPPWWTPMRLTVVIILLIACIVAIIVWNRLLKAQSERRGKALCQEQLNAAQAELKVEERTRLAVEIHDSMSQILTGTAMQIDAALRVGDKGFPAIEGYLRTARKMLASCRHELRCCIWDLRSRTFEEKDMTEAVERTIAPHAGAANVSVRFNVPHAAFSDSTAHVALRIIRELVVNAIRHGHAAHIWIAGEFHDGTIRFSVRDDGIGFDPESVQGPAQGHFGLQGVRERLAAISGSIEVKSGNGSGTKVTVSFPAEKEEP